MKTINKELLLNIGLAIVSVFAIIYSVLIIVALIIYIGEHI